MSIVLAEDKQYYQDAAAIYAGAETLFQDEDTQPIHVPIIAPKRKINFDLVEDVPELNFSYDYLKEAMKHPGFMRSIALIGPLHSGKTSFVDIFVKHVRDTRSQKDKDKQVRVAKEQVNLVGNSATDSPWDNFKQTKPTAILDRYTDTRLDERERGISLKATPLSYMLADSRGKSHLINVMDTPGHVNFRDEADVATRMSDGILVVIDAAMGATECLKRHLNHLLAVDGVQPSNLILVISQIDRLVLELRLPPNDAYFKLKYMIDEVNAAVAEFTGVRTRTFKPEIGNVLFASGKFKFAFSLRSFATAIYVAPTRQDSNQSFLLESGEAPCSTPEEADVFAQCLWGDVYCDSGKFSKNPNDAGKRSFVQFVLEPLYKIMGACLGEEKESLQVILAEMGVFLSPRVLDANTSDILEAVMDALLGGVSAVVDAIAEFVPNPIAGGAGKVARFYTGNQASATAAGMLSGDPAAPLVVHCVKSVHTPDCLDFLRLARVYAGTLTVGQPVKVLGESYSARSGETEDACVSVVEGLFIPGGRYLVDVESVGPGNWVFISGLSAGGHKTCTVVDVSSQDEIEGEEMEIFRPIQFSTATAAVKVACEPLHPTELPRMVEGLRKLDRAYPQLHTRVEESGEHVVIGTGELYLDCALHDLRKLYGGDLLLEIKLADPVVVFSETVTETSQYQCSSASPNKLNALSFIAEPLSAMELSTILGPVSVESQFVAKDEFYLSKQWRKERQSLLTDSCGWDALAARSLWAFGPDWETGANILLNDTLPDQVSKADLASIREPIVQGFQWATREGPLVEEPMRNCKFKLLDAFLNGSEIARGNGQIIPTACRGIYASFLTASPRLMEPINLVEIECPAESLQTVFGILSRRRGHVLKDGPKPGTPLTTVLAYLPAIDSFGFETDLRLHTRGAAFGLSWFDHWAVVPGDPLDAQVVIRPLEAAPQQYLARDFLLKTRRRKGLAEEVLVQKYMDDVVGMGLVRGDGGDMW